MGKPRTFPRLPPDMLTKLSLQADTTSSPLSLRPTIATLAAIPSTNRWVRRGQLSISAIFPSTSTVFDTDSNFEGSTGKGGARHIDQGAAHDSGAGMHSDAATHVDAAAMSPPAEPPITHHDQGHG
jgi:hypothetical protein